MMLIYIYVACDVDLIDIHPALDPCLVRCSIAFDIGFVCDFQLFNKIRTFLFPALALDAKVSL